MTHNAENDAGVRNAADRVQRFLDARDGYFPIDVLAVVSRTGDRLLASDLRALIEQVDPKSRPRHPHPHPRAADQRAGRADDAVEA